MGTASLRDEAFSEICEKMKEEMTCPKDWRKMKKGGFEPGPNHPYVKAKAIIRKAGYRSQSGGEIYINGEFAINFFKGSNIIHISYIPWADDEEIDGLKGVY